MYLIIFHHQYMYQHPLNIQFYNYLTNKVYINPRNVPEPFLLSISFAII